MSSSNPRVGIIVQARTSSSRLPAKMLLDFFGKPLITQILLRLKRSNLAHTVICAIPDSSSDDYLAELVCCLPDIQLFRGSHTNLVNRYYYAAKSSSLDVICRFPADNVFPEPYLIDQAIDYFLCNQFDFVSNLNDVISNSGYPDGCGIEVFSLSTLEQLYESRSLSAEQKEHLALNYYDYVKKTGINGIRHGSPQCPQALQYQEVLDVNTLSDYLRLLSLLRGPLHAAEVSYDALSLADIVLASQP